MNTTYADILGRHDVEIPAHLEAQAEVPILTGAQRQGDVIMVPTRPGKSAATLVPSEGIPVVRGEAGGNTHLLVADGAVLWNPASTGGTTLGLVVIPDGAAAYMLHPEHGAMGMGPGSYIVRRQREQADEIRIVAD